MWKFQITEILDAYSLLDHLEDPTPCPSNFLLSQTGTEPQEVNPLYSQWKTRDKALFSMISSTLSPSAISLVMGQTSASGIWKIIVNRYTSVSRSNIVNLKRELNSIKKHSDLVTDYLQKIKETKNKLVSVGVLIDDEEILHIVLQARTYTPDLNNILDNQSYTDSQLVSVGNGNQLPISHTDLLTRKPLYKGSSKDGLYPITGLSFPSWNSRVSNFQSSSKHTEPSHATLHSSYTTSLPKSDLSSTDLWHMRLGHPQHRVLHRVLNCISISHTLPMSNNFCKHCVMGKMT
uniref:GAG-pre-integrase domain-containing protein n=1 Tax=Fagus sylvatica TaxID=28930 RepID=A0A2N9J2N6_FAGSY